MDFLRVTNVSKKHGNDFLLDNISFSQAMGHRIAIAGETGSGKTTLMRIIAGLGQADSGTVFFEGKQVKGIDEKLMPGHKGIAYLSQHFELPNKYRVSELLSYANDLTDKANEELYAVCDIRHLMHRWSHTLSGGEKQRVALAKLLTTAPRLLLLDEPYSNLDLHHRRQLKNVVWNLGEKLGVTCMLISHEPDDILPWADEVFVMQHGMVVQRGTPQQVYKQPVSEYVAGLLGAYNVLMPALAAKLGMSATSLLRPEDIVISIEGSGIPAIINKVLYNGGHCELEVTAEEQTLIISVPDGMFRKGDAIHIQTKRS